MFRTLKFSISEQAVVHLQHWKHNGPEHYFRERNRKGSCLAQPSVGGVSLSWKEQILDKWQAVTVHKDSQVSNVAVHMQGDPGEVRIISPVILNKIHPT